MRRENDSLETYKSLRENRARLAKAEIDRINESAAKRDDFRNSYDIARQIRARKDAEHANLMEAARNDALSTVLKAIYITALEADTLTDDALILAENMVDKWIEESGGASKILGKVGNNTYLLARITQIVEDAAEADVKELEHDEDEQDMADGYAEGKKDAALVAAKDFINTADKDQIKDFVAQITDEIHDKKTDDAKPMSAETTEDGETIDATSDDIPDAEDAKTDIEDDVNNGTSDDQGEVSDVELELPPAEDTPAKEENPAEETPADTSDEVKVEDDKSEDPLNTSFDDEAPAAEEPKAEEPAPSTDEVKVEEPAEETPADTEAPAADEVKVEDEPKAEENPEAPAADTSDEVKVEEPTDETPAEEPAADTEEAPVDNAEEEAEKAEEDAEKADDEAKKAEIDAETDEELGEPLDDDGIDQDTTVDGDTENTGRVFDQLDKEDDVQKAVELIRSRVADAEETFIRNNAEDKKKIDELLTKISTNVKTVNDLDKEDTKAKIAEESARMYKRQLDEIKNHRATTVFESMARAISKNIVLDENARNMYVTESGSLDTDLVVESAKVMYAFFETINTLQLEKVDPAYIAKTLDNI